MVAEAQPLVVEKQAEPENTRKNRHTRLLRESRMTIASGMVVRAEPRVTRAGMERIRSLTVAEYSRRVAQPVADS